MNVLADSFWSHSKHILKECIDLTLLDWTESGNGVLVEVLVDHPTMLAEAFAVLEERESLAPAHPKEQFMRYGIKGRKQMRIITVLP